MTRRLLSVLFLLLFPVPARATPAFVEVHKCRPPEEQGEFLQTCVKVNIGKHAGRVLGPGLVAPGGNAAAVLQHRRYGGWSDRVMVRVHGPAARFEGTYRMGVGGEEYPLSWSPTGRFLAWIEVDGRGGQLRVVDRERRRLVLSALSPLEEWPVFAPSGSKLLLPVGRRSEEGVTELALLDLLVKRSRQVVLAAGPDEELVQPRWISPSAVQALRRKLGADRGGKLVRGSFQPAAAPPPAATAPAGTGAE